MEKNTESKTEAWIIGEQAYVSRTLPLNFSAGRMTMVRHVQRETLSIETVGGPGIELLGKVKGRQRSYCQRKEWRVYFE